MKPFLITTMLVAAASIGFGEPRPSAGETERHLVALERDWGRAMIERDVKFLDRFLADDWVASGLGEPLTKSAFIADVRSGATVTQAVEYGEIKVRVYGDAAVVTGSNTEKATYKGRDSSGLYLWTDVFVKRDNMWRLVASHYTKVK